MSELMESVRRFYPELVLTAGLLLVVVVDALSFKGRNAVNWWLTVGTFAAALALCPALPALHGPLSGAWVIFDPMRRSSKGRLLLAPLLVVGAFGFAGSR